MFPSNRRILWQEHSFWFHNLFKKKKNFYFIGIFKNQRIGFIKIEETKNNNFNLSINITNKFRNKGLGKFFLRKSCDNFFKKIKTKEITALVKINNNPSKKIFDYSYFKIKERTEKYLYYSRLYK
jgi:RimJ/RimL family protein N-acetyltransferase